MKLDIEILRNSVLFSLSMSKFNNMRQGDIKAFAAEQGGKSGFDPKFLGLKKRLILSDELTAIENFQQGLYLYIAGNKEGKTGKAVPSFFKKGIYLLHNNKIAEVEKRLKQARIELADLVAKFVSVYPSQVQQAREALNGQFDAKEYPSVEDIGSCFSIKWEYIQIEVPDMLPIEIRNEQADRLRETFEQAKEAITSVLMEGFAKILAHVSDRLGKEGNKPRQFRNTLFEDLCDFVKEFPTRNLANDKDLARLVTQANEILDKVRGDDARDKAIIIRDAEDMREKTQKALESIRQRVDESIVARPVRKFDLSLAD